MLKRNYCLCEIVLDIEPKDPILIKSGYEAVDGTKMAFITTNRRGKPEVFLPGSSLKGVFRSYFEKICRTLRPEDAIVCLPYKEYPQGGSEISCGAMFQHRRDLEKDERLPKDILAGKSENVYLHSCPACRMFGSNYFIGRCSTSDAYLDGNLKDRVEPEVRPGVAIDRHSGKVAQGPFDYHALTSGVFTTTIAIRNFELWMLGAWAYLLQDLQDHLIRIGAHKSRGMGTVEAKVKHLRLSYYHDPGQKVQGLGEMVPATEASQYGLHKSDGNLANLEVAAELRGVRRVYDITTVYPKLLPQLAPVFNHYIDHLDWWQPLQQYANGRS